MKYLTSILLLLFAASSNASVYTQSGDGGSAVYSDIPLSTQSKEMDLSNTSTGQVSAPASPSKATTPIAPERKPYTSFAIAAPTDKQTIQNQPVITVKLNVIPELQKGDTIQIYLDGKPQGQPAAATDFNLNLVERGEHQLSAVLFDANQMKLKQSGPITIYVHRASVNQPAKPANP